MLAYLDARDRHVSGRLESWRPPDWFRLWMLIATRLADGWLWLILGFVLLLSRDFGVFAAAGVASTLANAATLVLKRRFSRRRPSAFVKNAFLKAAPADVHACDRFSFPSGHTMNAFAIGTVLAIGHPTLAPLIWGFAASVGLSRLVLRMHFLTDVLAGTVLGGAIGCLASALVGL